MAYKYLGAPYPPDVGVLLPGVSVTLFPHRISDSEVKMLLDEMPHLRRFWDDDGLPLDDASLGNVTNEDKNANGIPDRYDDIWTGLINLDPQIQRLRIETAALNNTVNMLSALVASQS